MKLRSDYRAAVMMKNRLHHESGEPIEEPIHPGQQRRIQQGQELFSEDCFSSARVDNIQDGNIGFHLPVPRGGTHPNGVGSELVFFVAFFVTVGFVYSRWRSTVTDGESGHIHLTRDFVDTLILVHTSHCGSRLKVSQRVSHEKMFMHMSSHV